MSGEYGIIGKAVKFGVGFPAWCVECPKDAIKYSNFGRKRDVDFPRVGVLTNRAKTERSQWSIRVWPTGAAVAKFTRRPQASLDFSASDRRSAIPRTAPKKAERHGPLQTRKDKFLTLFLHRTNHQLNLLIIRVAERTGLEPATSAVTGQRSNH